MGFKNYPCLCGWFGINISLLWDAVAFLSSQTYLLVSGIAYLALYTNLFSLLNKWVVCCGWFIINISLLWEAVAFVSSLTYLLVIGIAHLALCTHLFSSLNGWVSNVPYVCCGWFGINISLLWEADAFVSSLTYLLVFGIAHLAMCTRLYSSLNGCGAKITHVCCGWFGIDTSSLLEADAFVSSLTYLLVFGIAHLALCTHLFSLLNGWVIKITYVGCG